MTAPGLTAKPPLQRAFETWLFRARWLLVPIYAGLVAALVGLVVVFFVELVHAASGLTILQPKFAIVAALSLLDLSLTANLLVIVIFSGYENFVSTVGAEDSNRPTWMGEVGFSGLKQKLMNSIVAISAVALLRAFVEVSEGQAPIDERGLAWLVGIQLTFVASAMMLALIDFIASRSNHDS